MNRKVLGIGIAVLLSSLCVSGTARADFDFRCDGNLITSGDTKPEVHAKCGEPTAVTRPRTVLIDIDGVLWPMDVDEEWVYNLGPHQFIRYVRFRDGRVVNVDHGKYGWIEHD